MIDISVLKNNIYDVIGAIHEVHSELGPGLNESCYQEGLQMEFNERNIPFEREMPFHPSYHGVSMESLFQLDFLCKNDIIVECKAVPELIKVHRTQLFNYMRLLNIHYGILVNFLPPTIDYERYFYDEETKQILGVDGQVVYYYKR